MFNNFFVFDNFKTRIAILQREFKNDELDIKKIFKSQKMSVTDFFRGHFWGDWPLYKHDEGSTHNDKFDCSCL